MNIIVCVKQIRHTYARTGSDPNNIYFNPEDFIYRINPYDEAALELALQLKDKIEETTISLLTIGDIIAERELRRCLAAGADHLYQILPDRWVTTESVNHANSPFPELMAQPSPMIKAELIANAAKSLKADLILCGKCSLDKANGQVGALVAKRLDLPYVSAITDILFEPESGEFRVKRAAGRGVREEIACSKPALFSVDTGIHLRLPTLEAKKLAENYEIRKTDLSGQSGSSYISAISDRPSPDTVCRKIFQPRPRPRFIPPPGSNLDAYDRISQLLAGSKVEKTGKVLRGTPASQVDGIIDFLQENGFIVPGTS